MGVETGNRNATIWGVAKSPLSPPPTELASLRVLVGFTCFAAVIGATCPSGEIDTKSCLTAAACISDGSRLMQDGDSQIALRFFERAILLDPHSQCARVYAGIANVHLGRAEPARTHFATASDIEAQTQCGNLAVEWLERLGHPKAVVIAPFTRGTQEAPWILDNKAKEMMAAYLFQTGLYNVVESPSRLSSASDVTASCRLAKDVGGDHLILGTITRFEDASHPGRRDPLGIIVLDPKNTYYDALIHISVQVYDLSSCIMVLTHTLGGVARNKTSPDLAIDGALIAIFQNILPMINERLN